MRPRHLFRLAGTWQRRCRARCASTSALRFAASSTACLSSAENKMGDGRGARDAKAAVKKGLDVIYERLRKDPYEALKLGGKKGLKQKDVKKAYHKLALKYHPDKNKDTVGLFCWYMLAGMLVTGVSYNYVMGSACTKTKAQIEAAHKEFAAEQEKIRMETAKNPPKVYTITGA